MTVRLGFVLAGLIAALLLLASWASAKEAKGRAEAQPISRITVPHSGIEVGNHRMKHRVGRVEQKSFRSPLKNRTGAGDTAAPFSASFDPSRTAGTFDRERPFSARPNDSVAFPIWLIGLVAALGGIAFMLAVWRRRAAHSSALYM